MALHYPLRRREGSYVLRQLSYMHSNACWRNGSVEAAYEEEWLEAHMRDAEERLGKPLLLEEFGKRLTPATVGDADAIAKLRDPVFRTTYDIVNRAITECATRTWAFRMQIMYFRIDLMPGIDESVSLGSRGFCQSDSSLPNKNRKIRLNLGYSV